ncbi:MAG: mannose-1-phosphate guanylyltransferase/mannose-6-phosphate isomerase [Betaproteobacteria bacterium]|nr:mannose-1-phosphate guanylyltransferase/mannose-6-phosphate isomerase [Betaproteobacteria bacterium]
MPDTSKIFPVILSGGSGTRLWPLSRALFPKQFLPLVSEKTMLQETASRVLDPARFHAPLFLCNQEHRFLVAEQLREMDVTPLDIVLEPHSRNTAPAIAAAALFLSNIDPEAIMLVLPSDHILSDLPAFHASVATGLAAVRLGRLVVFGIRPRGPVSDYGYIAQGDPLAGGARCFSVERFVEKPPHAIATALLAESRPYYWNAGIFLMRASSYIAELERADPSTVRACRDAIDHGRRDLDFFRLDADAYARARNDSIDYCVMQNTRAAAVVPSEMGWSDVGSWSVLWNIGSRDAADNVISGQAIAEDATGCYIRSEGPLVAAIGVSDLVIVATTDAVLVVPRGRAGDVRLATTRLATEGRQEHLSHHKVHRPWGSYQDIDAGDRFRVKRLVIRPGGKLSLQTHEHRAEHWIVVRGTARVTRGEEAFVLSENQSTYIPPRVPHRLENPGSGLLHLVEVQSGDYLGEDDIVRYDDVYGRA